MMNSKANKQAGTVSGSSELNELAAGVYRQKLAQHYEEDQRLYEEVLSVGVPKELARAHIPVGRYSRMRATANLRNWIQFLKLRQAPNAMWEIRQYANAVCDILKEVFPRTMELYEKHGTL
jgi:thymidylate synthase (FAD)